MTHSGHCRQGGFTLIELSIVLVIVGLIAGGILVGQNLIRTAQNRAVISEVEKLKTAVGTYRIKYNALVGDDPNATQWWGQNSTCPPPHDNILKTVTCNGDGDGSIGKYGGPWVVTWEWFSAIQQLANAGLIAGKYSGAAGPGATQQTEALPGINVPFSTISGAGYEIMDYSNAPALYPGSFFPGTYGNSVFIGKPYAGSALNNPAISPVDAMAIDQKIDDGLPGTGNLRTPSNITSPACVTTTNPATSVYAIATDGAPACTLIFNLGF